MAGAGAMLGWRRMSVPGPLRVSVPLLALLWLSPLPGMAAGDDAKAPGAEAGAFRPRLERAVRLYEALEYEKALHALAQARPLAATVDEQVAVALHRGIVLADLGRRKPAMEEFRAGLTLKPDAVLPLQVAPKVQRDFESVRNQVRSQQAASGPRQPASAEAAPPQQPAPPSAPVAETPAAPPPAETPAQALKSQATDLRSKLGAAGSVVGERVGTAVGSVLDKVVGPDRRKDGEAAQKDAPPAPEPTAKEAQ